MTLSAANAPASRARQQGMTRPGRRPRPCRIHPGIQLVGPGLHILAAVNTLQQMSGAH